MEVTPMIMCNQPDAKGSHVEVDRRASREAAARSRSDSGTACRGRRRLAEPHRRYRTRDAEHGRVEFRPALPCTRRDSLRTVPGTTFLGVKSSVSHGAGASRLGCYEFLVGQARGRNHRGSRQEAPAVVILPLVEAERLLINVRAEVERFDGDVRAGEGALHSAQKFSTPLQ